VLGGAFTIFPCELRLKIFSALGCRCTHCTPWLGLCSPLRLFLQHRSTRSSDIITLSRPPSSSSLKLNNRSFLHASPCLWNQLPKELRLPIQITKTYHSHLISNMSVRHFLHHHCHHPLLLLTSTPDSKLIFSTNPFLHSSSTFPPTGLTPRTPAVLRFSRACRF